MKIYLSGKISGLPPATYKRNFARHEQRVLAMYPDAKIVNPLRLTPFLGIKNWYCYMIADLWALLWCDAISVQSNYHTSRGALIEIRFAELMGKTFVI